MATVEVCKFRMYDITTDSWCTSRRYGRPKDIKDFGGMPMESTRVEIESHHLMIDGLTEIDFDPNPRKGFQQEVKRVV